jgi:pimeloyl-ACP methyl ester carboxylesterase
MSAKLLIMENLRTYGSRPYDVVLLHGGPGAPGSLESIARRLSISFGILEPAILSLSVKGQLEELKSILEDNSSEPLFFIGHSWGAWLGLLFASEYPGMVRKLIIIGTPPVTEKYVPQIEETRLSRLTEKEKTEYTISLEQLNDLSYATGSLSPDFVALLTKTDVCEALPNETIDSKFYDEVYRRVWEEASQMRSSGKLIAIHGDFDPHPAEGVREPLTKILPNFRFNLIEKCGHYPWKERNGKDILYKIFYKEIGSTCV